MIANVIPGYWMLRNAVCQSGEKQIPASSEAEHALLASICWLPSGRAPTTAQELGVVSVSSRGSKSPYDAVARLSQFLNSELSFLSAINVRHKAVR